MSHSEWQGRRHSKPESDYNEFRTSSTEPSTLETKNHKLRNLYLGIYHDAMFCSHVLHQFELETDELLPQTLCLAQWLTDERHRLLHSH